MHHKLQFKFLTQLKEKQHRHLSLSSTFGTGILNTGFLGQVCHKFISKGCQLPFPHLPLEGIINNA